MEAIMRLTRTVLLAFAALGIAAAAIAGSPGPANAGHVRHRPRIVVPLSSSQTLCNQAWLCDARGCGWREYCSPQTFSSAYEWQVIDKWPPELLAQYDDEWCRTYGPRGSPVYNQCRQNNYYTRLTVPIRRTK
jgi:hypothetical protein